MGVTNDLTLAVQLLGGSEIIGIGIHEVTRLHSPDGHGDGEGCFCFHYSKVGGECEFLNHIIGIVN